MKQKTCIISGATGQVGSFACEKLISEGYKVFGIKRRSSSLNTERLNHIFDNPNLKLIYSDLTDYASLSNIISDIKPDLFINCGAQSHVAVSFSTPCATQEATGNSVLNCLEAIRIYSPETRFITMSSSEMYGSSPAPQNELTKFQPQSPYAVAKINGYYYTTHYRERGLFAANAICFNTESPRRGETFLTRKVSRSATRIKLGLQDKLVLGRLDTKRDWQAAQDTVDALYKIITADEPDDYVVASGVSHSVQEFVEVVFGKLGLNWKDYVVQSQEYFRPTEVEHLCGDASKLRTKLGWAPKYTFDQLVDDMIESDMKLAKQEKLIKDNG